MFDDVEGESGQHKMMVGSLNAASKFTKGEGEEEQLGGTIYTKNLKIGMKMPSKIVEGRNNWLLMERDRTYELEDMGSNCESNFEHSNEMCNVSMPRDFLASLTQYFIRPDASTLSLFQDAHREACEIMADQRPHWRKRKSKSNSLFISFFFLVEKEVEDSDDEVCKELFFKIFVSCDEYIDLVMKAMDRVDEIEAAMAEGSSMDVPSWAVDDGDDTSAADSGPKKQVNGEINEVDIDKIVVDTLKLIEKMDDLEKSKYANVIKNGKTQILTIALRHTKLKDLAKRNEKPIPKFLTQQKKYPAFVTLKTEIFTKLTATSSRGAQNTSAAFCTSIQINKLVFETRTAIKDAFSLDDDSLLIEDIETLEESEPSSSQMSSLSSQSRSQSSETLKVCDVCDFTSRSSSDMHSHKASHPTCEVCNLVLENVDCLAVHSQLHATKNCEVCNLRILESDLKKHVESHTSSEKYRTGLASVKSKKRAKPNNTVPRLNSFHVFCKRFRETKKRENPTLNMLGINALLRDDWKKLTDAEKALYKPSNENVETPALSGDDDATPEPSIHPVSVTQTQIKKCNLCGRMFLDDATLAEHKQFVHQPAATSVIQSTSTDVADVLDEFTLHWLKVGNIMWPCKKVNEGSSLEVVKVVLFNDDETVLDVEVSKLKPFSKLKSIPRSRTAEWRRGYQKAIDI